MIHSRRLDADESINMQVLREVVWITTEPIALVPAAVTPEVEEAGLGTVLTQTAVGAMGAAAEAAGTDRTGSRRVWVEAAAWGRTLAAVQSREELASWTFAVQGQNELAVVVAHSSQAGAVAVERPGRHIPAAQRTSQRAASKAVGAA